MLAREHLLLFSGIGRMPATEMERSGIEVQGLIIGNFRARFLELFKFSFTATEEYAVLIDDSEASVNFFCAARLSSTV